MSVKTPPERKSAPEEIVAVPLKFVTLPPESWSESPVTESAPRFCTGKLIWPVVAPELRSVAPARFWNVVAVPPWFHRMLPLPCRSNSPEFAITAPEPELIEPVAVKLVFPRSCSRCVPESVRAPAPLIVIRPPARTRVVPPPPTVFEVMSPADQFIAVITSTSPSCVSWPPARSRRGIVTVTAESSVRVPAVTRT